MPRIAGCDRSQLLLLPESLDDYAGPENPARFIKAFVDGLDRAAAGFARVGPRGTGRPSYPPANLLKLYIYGYGLDQGDAAERATGGSRVENLSEKIAAVRERRD